MSSVNSTSDTPIALDQQETEAEGEYFKLRKLVLGPDYDKALHDYISREDDLERVADVLSEAIKKCTKDDPALGRALAPILNKAIHESISNNPSRITNVIFPIMGPAIRKAVSAALKDMVQSLNRVLEQSLSMRGLVWRVKALRVGVPYGQYVMSKTLRYVVEQVFLVHRETGLLLHSVVDERANAKDPDLVSSMLTAIQDFVNDSFDTQHESNLDRIQMGDLTLHLMVGQQAVMAIAVRGTIGSRALNMVNDVFDSIQRCYASELSDFSGEREVFLSTEDDLRECLLSEHIASEDQNQRRPVLALIALSILLVFSCYKGYWHYQYGEELDRIMARIADEPGYVLLNSAVDDDVIHAKVLRSPVAVLPETLTQSIDSRFYKIRFDSHIVTFGDVDIDKLNQLSAVEPPTDPGLLARYPRLMGELQTISIQFEENSDKVEDNSLNALSNLISGLKELLSLADQLNMDPPQIMVMGFADSQGSRYGNINVSQQRAEHVKTLLVENGISPSVIIAWGLGHRDTSLLSEREQRRVSIHITGVSKITEQNQLD